jgi:hypothetical protein
MNSSLVLLSENIPSDKTYASPGTMSVFESMHVV